jgi:hypothetical protein
MSHNGALKYQSDKSVSHLINAQIIAFQPVKTLKYIHTLLRILTILTAGNGQEVKTREEIIPSAN